MQEIWIDIEGYEGLYQVSNLGNIRSLNYNRTGKTRTLKTCIKKDYVVINLCKNNMKKNYQVHRLVAQAFIPNCENKTEVNHIDGNKENNAVDNLEWATRSENMQHAFKNGLCDNQRMASKLSICKAVEVHATKYSKQVKCITTNITYSSTHDAERLTGIAHSNIAACCNGKRKSAGKLPDGTKLEWRYIDE